MPGKTLDLDTLFGRQDPIVVTYQGRRFPMRLPASLSPVEMLHLDAIREDYQRLTLSAAAGLTDEQSLEMERLARAMLQELCPELVAQEIPFAMQMRVMKFYTDEVNERTNPKPLEAPATLTGDMSSPLSRSGTG